MLRYIFNRSSVVRFKSIVKEGDRLRATPRKALLFSSVGIGLFMGGSMLPLDSIGVVYAASLEAHTEIIATAKLSKVPTEKATVGVIPYYVQDGQIYLLLGRERIDGSKKERAGKFSDFGGSVELDGSTLLQNAVRELKEESMGRIIVSEQDLLSKGRAIYKLSSKNREIFYVFYPMSEQEYNNTKHLNALWPQLCRGKIETSDCEKDQYVWLNAEDLQKRAMQVRDIDGNIHYVKLREFFKEDCLENPAFSKLLAELGQSKNKVAAVNRM